MAAGTNEGGHYFWKFFPLVGVGVGVVGTHIAFTPEGIVVDF